MERRYEDFYERLYWVTLDCIYDNFRAADMHSIYSDYDVFECNSLELARILASSGPDKTYHEKFEQYHSYVNDKGQTVYQIFTDGACDNNGKENAAAGCGVFFGDNSPYNYSSTLSFSYPHTSQTAELGAILIAYDTVEDIYENLNDKRFFEVYTDSSYAIDCLTKWCHTWKRNGWKTQDGVPVKNKDLIEAILKMQQSDKCRNVLGIKKVQAHGTSEGNNKADQLARDGIYKKIMKFD
ncbi:Ribonuclease H [Yarrowia sp. B02]|nr:Ribonuclease H [Yarrowia sp. B02]